MSDTTQQFKKQLPKNAISAVLTFITYSVSAVWLTPYLVFHLGEAAYGLVPLAGLLTQYVAIVTKQISGAVNRFLTLEINKPDGDADTVFSSAFILYILLALVQIPIFVLGIIFADRLFTIPAPLKADALILLGCSAGSFLISLVGAVFNVSAFSKNRLDVSNTINLFRHVARLVLIFASFSLFGAKLRFIGYVDLGISAVTLPIAIGVWRKLTPELSFSIKKCNLKILGPIFHMSFWTLINQLGAVLFLRMDIWIINKFISPVMAGVYAAVIVVANFVRQLGMMMNAQLGPVVMRYWAKEEKKELSQLLTLSVKFFSLILAIPSALICFGAQQLLSVWLGVEFSSYSTLLIVLCIHLPITVALFPLYLVQHAANAINIPAVVTLVMGILNVVVSYILGVELGMGAVGVAVATAVVLSLRNTLFTAIYGAHLLRMPPFTYLTSLMYGVMMFIIVGTGFLLPVEHWLGFRVETLAAFAFKSFIIALIFGGGGMVILISRRERLLLLSMLPSKIRSRIPAWIG